MKTFLKLLCGWAAVGVSFLLSGVLVRLLYLPKIAMVDNTTLWIRALAIVMSMAVLVAGMWPVARGLAAAPAVRAAVLGVFLFLALGTNTIFDGTIYTSLFDSALLSSLLMYLLLAGLLGVALGAGFGEQGTATGFARHGAVNLAGRAMLAFAAWPVIYLFFGACVAPIVLPYYQNGAVPGIHIPPMQTIFAVQLVRSLVFLAASLPLIVLWKGSRRGLWVAMGLAHTVAVGLFGLVAATFLPAVLRVTHSAEIACDSFAYAGLLVLLFAAPGPEREGAALGSLGQGMQSTS